MPIGPTMPPHLAKRARDEDERPSSPESSEKRRRVAGLTPRPSESKTSPSPPRRVLGPARPPPVNSRSSSPESDDVGPAPPTVAKPKRVLGPAPPPAPLDERPPNPPSDDSDSSSDDDYGPAPPPAGAGYSADSVSAAKSAFDTDAQYKQQPKKIQRDEWMTMPPTQDDLAARMDPTKARPRKFNQSKAGASSTSDMDVWTETPEQKLKRLQDEAMGIAAPSNSSDTGKSKQSRREEEETRRIRERVQAARGQSLVEKHTEKGTGKEKEDDPSKRGFDWGKDMNAGMKIGNKQRNDMIKSAKSFGDRFSSGSFL